MLLALPDVLSCFDINELGSFGIGSYQLKSKVKEHLDNERVKFGIMLDHFYLKANEPVVC